MSPDPSLEPPDYLIEEQGEYSADDIERAQAQTREEPEAWNRGTIEDSPLRSSAGTPLTFSREESLAHTKPNINPEKLLAGLNSEQAQAVSAGEGHWLVLAGAGSGKTRVLTHRLCYVLATGRANPTQVMAVTFTNKAAKEMLSRLQSLSVRHTYSMWVGTFHGLCHRFLRAHFAAAGLSKTFQIIDTDEQVSTIRQIMEAKKINLEDTTPREVMSWINARKEKGERAGDIKSFEPQYALMGEIYTAYEEHCGREHLVDFAELLLRTLEVLKRQSALREAYQQRFRHILVDEFQDTNVLQYDFLKLLCGEKTALFAVGDDDQSIYGFRGARVENLRDFEKRFARGQVIRLEQSYRSTGAILNTANTLIAYNAGRLGKTLWTAQGQGEPINVFPAYNDEEEARWVMGEIRKLADEGTPWSDIAILYRINAHSRSFEQAAMAFGIPYRIYGGFRFYDRAEVRHALAYLRLIVNPADEGSFLRVVNFPPRGVGERSLAQLRDLASERGCSLFAAMELMEGRTAASLQQFAQTIHRLRGLIANKNLPDIMSAVLTQSGLSAHYQSLRDGKERLENLDELINAATQYENEWHNRRAEGALDKEFVPQADAIEVPTTKNPPLRPLPPLPSRHLFDEQEVEMKHAEGLVNHGSAPINFLGETALVQFLSDAVLDSAERDGNGQSAINLMSVHAAKGLEFSAVFIGGLEHGTFPHDNNLDLEEERRLMYVAITRAKKTLKLSYTHQRLLHGRLRQNIPSLFLSEMPKELLRWVRPPSAAMTSREAMIHNEKQAGKYASGYSGTSRMAASKMVTRGNSALSNQNDGEDFNASLAQMVVRRGLSETGQQPFQEGALPFALGQRVRHAKFGDGLIQQYEGSGDDQRVLVSFGALGRKWLLLKLAKLIPMD